MKKADTLRAALAATETDKPAPAAQPAQTLDVRSIPIGKIKRSPTNPRTTWPAAEQQEMENSMREHGFTISTLLVRPEADTFFIDAVTPGQHFVMRRTPAGTETNEGMHATMNQAEKQLAELQGCYELVAGERRWRAAKAVGIEAVPCIVREMTNQQVLILQMLENLQRSDLTPMEEARGFARLLAEVDAQGRPCYTKASLAAAVGKGEEHIRRRVGLCRLADDPALADFVKAYETGVVGNRHAQLVLGVPDAKARVKFAKEILEPKWDEAPLSERKAELLKKRDYTIELRGAPFDLGDPDLLPVLLENGDRARGGACIGCPFLEELEGKSNVKMCMNPACFELKKKAEWEQWMSRETSVDKKRRALTEAECQKLYRFGDQLEWNCGLVDLAERPDSSDLKPGEVASATWKKLIGDAEMEVLVVKDRNGKRHELVERELALLAAKVKGCRAFKEAKTARDTTPELEGSDSGLRGEVERQREENEDERNARLLKAANVREIAAAEDAAVAAEFAKPRAKLPVGFWAEIIQQILEEYCGEAPANMEWRRGWKDGALMSEAIKLTENEQMSLVCEFLWWASRDGRGADADGKTVLKMFAIDPKAVRKAAAEATKAEQKKRAALRAQIVELAGKLNLPAKPLDAMALNTPAKEKFGLLNDTASMEALHAALMKLSSSPSHDGRKAKGGKK